MSAFLAHMDDMLSDDRIFAGVILLITVPQLLYLAFENSWMQRSLRRRWR